MTSIRFAVVAALFAAALAMLPCQAAQAAEPPSDRVVVYYFHRTERCPTCKRISALIEEALDTGFAEQLKDRRVTLYMVDYENKKNKRYVKYYELTRPTLVIADVKDGEVRTFKKMPKVWSLVFDKEKFLKYVQKQTRAYLEKSS